MKFLEKQITELSPEEKTEIENFISKCMSTVIATYFSDGEVRLSTLSNLPGQTTHELYYITDKRTTKIQNLIENNNAQLLMYIDDIGEIILSGKISFIDDISLKEEKWQPWADEFFSEGPKDPLLAFIKFEPQTIRFFMM